MTEIKDKNWKITLTGSLSAIAISVFYLYLVINQASFNNALLLAMASGVLYALSSKIAEINKYSTISKPLSGFLSMISATLILGSLAFLFTGSAEVIGSAISSQDLFSGIKTAILTLVGLIGLITGTYFTTQGITLLSSDRVGSKTSLGPRRSDFLFSVILTGITVFSISGTAMIKDVPVTSILSDVEKMLIFSETFSGIITSILIILAYLVFRKAWRELPIQESIPEKHLDKYSKASKIETVLGWALIPLLAFLLILKDFSEIRKLEFLEVLRSSGIRQTLVEVFLISLTIIVVVKLIQLLTGDRDKIKSLGPYIVFGAIAWIISPLLIPFIDNMITLVPEAFSSLLQSILDVGKRNAVLVLLTIASWISFGLKSLTGTVRAFGMVPSGIEGTTLASMGLFLTSIGFYIYQSIPSATVLFIGVALSLVVWEIGKRSTVLGMEIGRKGQTRQAEIVQVVTKLAVALVAVIFARTLLIFLQQSQINIGGISGLIFILSAIGLTFMIFSIKDYT